MKPEKLERLETIALIKSFLSNIMIYDRDDIRFKETKKAIIDLVRLL